MTLRSHLEEYLRVIDEIMQLDDSKIISAADQHWSKYDPRRLVFWQPATCFGDLSSGTAGGIDPSPHSNELPAGFRAHIEKYVTETKNILQAHPNADDQTLLEEAEHQGWGRKDPRWLVFFNGQSDL